MPINSVSSLFENPKFVITLKAFALAGVLFFASFVTTSVRAAGTQSVGRVLFSIGAVSVTTSTTPLKKGDAIFVGQTISTGANGHVHIRFIDDAFVSVRPNARLTIEQYDYDSQNPLNNRVRFELTQGVARLITGKAGQAAKENFRLNTPVAAIGIRGTDFLVQAKPALTRVAVQQGAIIIAPFSDDCAKSAAGPCGGADARELLGSLAGKYLEVKGAATPILVMPPNGRMPFELPRPEEPKVNVNGTSIKSAALPEGMSGSTKLMWGRWSGHADAPVGYEVVGHNDALVLFRSIEISRLPTTGFVSFQMQQSEAYGRRSTSGYEAAAVPAATFSVNFEKMSYATGFSWKFDGREHYFYSKGSISEAGRLEADREASNVAISGALNATGDEAAYVYFKNISSDLKAYGILRWER